jgi:SAM-dependent methyltransferase
MPITPLLELPEVLVCPTCRSRLASPWQTCSSCGCHFLTVDGKPVLVDFEHSVLDRAELVTSSGASPIKKTLRSKVLETVLLAFQYKNRVAPQQVNVLLDLARQLRSRPRVLVVGGGTIGAGMEKLYHRSDIDIVGFDIYATPYVQLIADAHHIPFENQTFDAAIVQAVLEHVVDPGMVVSELRRVLREDGLLYAETPFMQQVHEGPYDFTRFTESGHRFLFRDFLEVSSGVVAGPGLQLTWSIDYFCRGLFRSNRVGRLARLLFSWLAWFDRFVPERYAVDGGSCFFFLGRLTGEPIAVKDLVRRYKGAQRPVLAPQQSPASPRADRDGGH